MKTDYMKVIAATGVAAMATNALFDGMFHKKHHHKHKKYKIDEELLIAIGEGTVDYEKLAAKMKGKEIEFDSELMEKIKSGQINISDATAKKLDILASGNVPVTTIAAPNKVEVMGAQPQQVVATAVL